MVKRDKLGRFVKGKHYSPETEFKKGHKLSEESEMKRRKNLSKSLKGHIVTEKTKQKLSEASSNPSKETRKKMRENRKGKGIGNQNAKGNIPKNPFKKGNIPWNKNLKGVIKSWSKGLTKETDERLKKMGRNISKSKKGKFYPNSSHFKKGQMSKEKHHNWKGGISFEPYDKRWDNNFKNSIRKRDNQICMLCGIHREKLNKALDVHHINYDKKLTIPQNCISLCPSCHHKTSFNRVDWIKFFQSLLSKKYGYKYSENLAIICVEIVDKFK